MLNKYGRLTFLEPFGLHGCHGNGKAIVFVAVHRKCLIFFFPEQNLHFLILDGKYISRLKASNGCIGLWLHAGGFVAYDL
jgi:hypothetical protein